MADGRIHGPPQEADGVVSANVPTRDNEVTRLDILPRRTLPFPKAQPCFMESWPPDAVLSGRDLRSPQRVSPPEISPKVSEVQREAVNDRKEDEEREHDW